TAIEDIKLNGKLTLGENNGVRRRRAAGIHGIDDPARGRERASQDRRLHRAAARVSRWEQIWRQNRTPEASRMRAVTDPHSPGQYRVNGVVANMLPRVVSPPVQWARLPRLSGNVFKTPARPTPPRDSWR